MSLSPISTNRITRAANAFRLLGLALGALAIALYDLVPDPRLIPLAAGYLIAIALLWLLQRRVPWTWLAYVTAIFDVGAVTALFNLLPAGGAATWTLYILPVASNAAVGPVPAVLAATLSTLGYLGSIWLATGELTLAILWPVAVLIVATIVVNTLAAGWLLERAEKRAWLEIDAAARALSVGGEPDRVATLVVEHARRLARADSAWLWWCGAQGQLLPGPQSGRAPEHSLLFGDLALNLAKELRRKSVALADLAKPSSSLVGELVALWDDKEPVALLAVTWTISPRDRGRRRERLRIYARWAGNALGQARAREAERERLRREGVLARAAADMAGTLDRQAVLIIAANAARTGLEVAASVFERSSGRIVAGDLDGGRTARGRIGTPDPEHAAACADSPALGQPGGSLVAVLVDDLTLVAWRGYQDREEQDAVWLERLAVATRAAIERCVEHERLRAEEQLLWLTIAALPAPIALWDGTGILRYANPAYQALGAALPADWAALAGEEHEVTAGDPPRVFMATMAPSGTAGYVIAFYREITRERAALHAKDELIAMVGHELRTPLTSIYGYSQMMARQLGIVKNQVDQINRLIGNFVELARLEDGHVPLVRERVDLLEIARMAAERFRGGNEGRVLELELAEVPPVDGDPVRLSQVVDNLLSNAAKYSDKAITLAVQAVEDRVLLSVQDLGAGIDPEHLPHVFKRFYRAPGAQSQRVEGLGLGLAICRDIVSAHGGEIWAESPGLGRGTTFHVSLPVATPAERPAIAALPAGGSERLT